MEPRYADEQPILATRDNMVLVIVTSHRGIVWYGADAFTFRHRDIHRVSYTLPLHGIRTKSEMLASITIEWNGGTRTLRFSSLYVASGLVKSLNVARSLWKGQGNDGCDCAKER